MWDDLNLYVCVYVPFIVIKLFRCYFLLRANVFRWDFSRSRYGIQLRIQIACKNIRIPEQTVGITNICSSTNVWVFRW